MPGTRTFPLRAISLPLSVFSAVIALAAPVAMAAEPPSPVSAAEPSAARSAAGPASERAGAPESDKDSQAREALRKSVEFHREAKDLTLAFRAEVYNAALDKEDAYQGRLLLKGSDKFRLEIPGASYVSDGSTYWEHHAGTGQVIMRRARDMEEKPLPGDVLLRFLDSDPLSLESVKADGRAYWEMRLDPSRAMKNLDSVAVLLDKKTYSLHRISSRDVSGNEAVYTVSRIRRNAGLKDGEFAFAVPKGAEVVDMRDE